MKIFKGTTKKTGAALLLPVNTLILHMRFFIVSLIKSQSSEVLALLIFHLSDANRRFYPKFLQLNEF